jgi:hypothetical protein
VTAPRAWARGDGVVLRAASDDELAREDVQRALRDGIERGYVGEFPPAPVDAEWYAIDAADDLVGVFALRRGVPHAHAATVHALAIVVAQRGHAYGARALFALERRLVRDGVREVYARVARTNGRGLYFMLRCGYAPVAPLEDDGATWFRRAVAAKASPRVKRVSGRGARAPIGDSQSSRALP